jgi:peptide-methionine (S)-S-oxide reductase
MEGIVRVVAGYTGGDHADPCHTNLKDHTEALLIEYNPYVISYRNILEMWHDNDFPWEPERLGQRSAVFYLSLEQREQALAFLHYLLNRRPNCYLYVDLEPAKVFYQAEEDQQNYISKQYKAARDKVVAWANNETKSGLFSIVE